MVHILGRRVVDGTTIFVREHQNILDKIRKPIFLHRVDPTHLAHMRVVFICKPQPFVININTPSPGKNVKHSEKKKRWSVASNTLHHSPPPPSFPELVPAYTSVGPPSVSQHHATSQTRMQSKRKKLVEETHDKPA